MVDRSVSVLHLLSHCISGERVAHLSKGGGDSNQAALLAEVLTGTLTDNGTGIASLD